MKFSWLFQLPTLKIDFKIAEMSVFKKTFTFKRNDFLSDLYPDILVCIYSLWGIPALF